jgi:predicted phage terminase large subunit-like protein
LPDNLRLYQGVDLAISKKEAADYFAIVTIGKDQFNNIYLIDVFSGKYSFLQQFNKIVDRATRYDPIRVFVEANAYQVAQSHLLMALSDVRVKPIITVKDKVTRAWKISIKFENHQVFFPKFGVQEFSDNLIAFPDVDHDDEFDAFDLAVSGSSFKLKKPRPEFGVI